MYEAVMKGITFILAGSIRDDGPLPEVITDTAKAKDAMDKALRGVNMTIMLGTMLHAIAVGNLLPSFVKTICVDINPATVTKLMDRGSAQAIGLVTDIGIFLPRLAEEINKQEMEPEMISCEDAEYIFVAFGLSARICQKSIDLARAKGIKVGLFRPITLYPFPTQQIAELAKKVKGMLVVEMNAGQMIEDVKLAAGCSLKIEHYGRFGGNLSRDCQQEKS